MDFNDLQGKDPLGGGHITVSDIPPVFSLLINLSLHQYPDYFCQIRAITPFSFTATMYFLCYIAIVVILNM